MALIACRECRREVSTAAAACPHCGCPVAGAAPPAPAHPRCYSCGGPASRACTACGKMCCEDHITWWNNVRNAGATCTDCASLSWVWTVLGLIVAAIFLLVMFSKMPGGGPLGR